MARRYLALVRTPSKATLKKYGLTEEQWRAILDRQDGVCFVCRKEPSSGTLHIDHDHAPRWKSLSADERVRFIRGLLCWWCNSRYVGRAITVEKARRVVEYLEAYAARNDAKHARGQ